MQTKKKAIIIFIATFIFVLPISLNSEINWGDELWNFQSTYKMYLGNQIYTDINVIQTPLFFYIGEALFKIMGANLFIFRVYNSIIIGLLMSATYILCKSLNMNKKFNYMFLFIMFMYFMSYFAILQANYNILALSIYIIGVIISIKTNNKTKYAYIMHGIIALIIFLTKQNIGIFYLIGLITSILLQKDKIKIKIKKSMIALCSFTIGVGAYSIILYSNGSLNGFIDYCILGIKEFGIYNIGFDILELILACFIIIISIATSIFLLKNSKTQKMLSISEKVKIKNMLIFSICLLPTMYPIFNTFHIKTSIYLFIINIAYSIYIIFKDFELENKIKKVGKIITLLIAIIFAIWEIYLCINWTKEVICNNQYKYTYKDVFFGAKVEEELKNNITKVTEFINNSSKDVIIISPKSTLYNLPLKKNNGKFDLVLKGNLGKDGEERLIEDIKTKKNTIILIEEKEQIFQESDKIKKYIKDNLEKNGTIEEFCIYKTKE